MRSFTTADLDEINIWLKNRGLLKLRAADVPRFGMIEPDVAVGFITLTDANTYFLEGFVTNPKADPKDRDKALGKISRWLLGVAASAGVKRCIVLTQEKSLECRAIDLGFKESKLKCFIKEF